MSEPFVGEIRMVGFNFAPQGWATCDGQLMPISQNTALFSLLGTQYGGDGINTFGLPDMRGRVPVHMNQGGGPTPYTMGDRAGVESVTLNTNQLPAHNHPANASPNQRTSSSPSNRVPSAGGYYDSNFSVTMSPQAIGNAGGGQSHENRQPLLVVNFIIALQGIFPSRN